MRGDCCRLNPSRLIIIISPQFTTQASCVDIRSATRVDTHAALPAALLLFLFPPNQDPAGARRRSGYRRAAPCLRFRGKAGRRRGLRPGGPEEWSRRRGRDPLGGGGTERPAAEGRRPGEHINPLCVRSFCYFVRVFPSNNDRISICIYVDLRKLQNEEEIH